MKSDKNPIKLRAIFMGTSSFAEQILAGLIAAQFNIISVYTQPDKKVGREQKVQVGIVKALAEKSNIPVFTPNRFDAQSISEFQGQKPDIVIVASYGKILPKELLEFPGFGAINVHASLLPKYRGASPIQNAILNGEKETGVSIMLMDEGVDTGAVLAQKKFPIGPDETTPVLSQKLARFSSELLLETLTRWIERKIKPEKQDDSKASLCQLIERSDGKIIWTDGAQEIYNRYRAFYAWPGVYTFWENNGAPKRLKLNKINFMEDGAETKRHIGEVFQIGEKFGVQTTSGIIILQELQMEGKNNVTIAEFINGYPDFIGSVLM